MLSQHSHGMRFYGSSILVIYCADSVERARLNDDPSLLKAECRLVDFQKVKLGDPSVDGAEFMQTIDEDSLNGVNSLIATL